GVVGRAGVWVLGRSGQDAGVDKCLGEPGGRGSRADGQTSCPSPSRGPAPTCSPDELTHHKAGPDDQRQDDQAASRTEGFVLRAVQEGDAYEQYDGANVGDRLARVDPVAAALCRRTGGLEGFDPGGGLCVHDAGRLPSAKLVPQSHVTDPMRQAMAVLCGRGDSETRRDGELYPAPLRATLPV